MRGRFAEYVHIVYNLGCVGGLELEVFF